MVFGVAQKVCLFVGLFPFFLSFKTLTERWIAVSNSKLQQQGPLDWMVYF